MTEQWREIARYPGFYVSDLGNLRNPDSTPKGQWKLSIGYMQTQFGKKKESVHRLVAEAFIPKIAGKPEVNHINNDRGDERACNLEWMTRSENMKYAYTSGNAVGNALGKFSADHPTSKAVIATPMDGGKEIHFECGMDAVRLGFRSDGISRCCNGLIAHHARHYWRFA